MFWRVKISRTQRKGANIYMATHKTTKSNRQIDVNSAFSKAIDKKSTNQVTWQNDIEQPSTKRYKKPQLRVNMAERRKIVFREDGTVSGLGSSSEDEDCGPAETTNP